MRRAAALCLLVALAAPPALPALAGRAVPAADGEAHGGHGHAAAQGEARGGHAHAPGCPWRDSGLPCPHAHASEGRGPAIAACGEEAAALLLADLRIAPPAAVVGLWIPRSADPFPAGPPVSPAPAPSRAPEPPPPRGPASA